MPGTVALPYPMYDGGHANGQDGGFLGLRRDPVIVRPNSQTNHERIVDVLNACAAAGIKNLTFS